MHSIHERDHFRCPISGATFPYTADNESRHAAHRAQQAHTQSVIASLPPGAQSLSVRDMRTIYQAGAE